MTKHGTCRLRALSFKSAVQCEMRLRLIFRSGAHPALGLDLTGLQQRMLRERRADKLVNQHGKKHHVAHDGAVGERGCGQRHAERNAGLRQQRDAQMLFYPLAAMRQRTAPIRAADLAEGAEHDVDHADQKHQRVAQDIQIQLRAGNYEKQNADRTGPPVEPLHQLLGSRADIAENRAGHHADEQQREADVDAADLKVHLRKADHQEHERHRKRKPLTARMEIRLEPVQKHARDGAEHQREDDLDDRLKHDADHADAAVLERHRNAE